MSSAEWETLQRRIVACQRCPRLRTFCQEIAQRKRRAYQEWDYWGHPVPNFGEPDAELLIVGLAPAAHGANRTGRMFTGDRSGDVLYRALYETGFATQPSSVSREDGLRLRNAVITAVVHCAPPQNRPTREEIAACRDFLEQTVRLLPRLQGVVALGAIAFAECLRLFRQRRWWAAPQTPKFAHGLLLHSPGAPFLLASYHPSQQNTFTGRLTPAMLREVFARAASLLHQPLE
jgi:uracil-DNA glycosylase family 4